MIFTDNEIIILRKAMDKYINESCIDAVRMMSGKDREEFLRGKRSAVELKEERELLRKLEDYEQRLGED